MNNDICLVAIVRDEAQYIERMLRSALPHCKDAVICDTGSKDDTVRIARNMLVEFGVQGTLVTEGWANFSHNRNLALERARKSGCDWILLLDGDEELVVKPAIPDDWSLEWGYNIKHDRKSTRLNSSHLGISY